LAGLQKCEIAVVGSGPGGSIAACLLAEAGRHVLLVEEGPFLQQDSCEPFSRDEMVTKYRNGGITVALGKPKVAYVEGRCVGGGSEINAGLWHRTPEYVLQGWEEDFGAQAVSKEEMGQHFDIIEQDLAMDQVSSYVSESSARLAAGADALGWESVIVPRAVDIDGTTYKRKSMTRNYIPRALAAGCNIVSDTRVTRLRRSGSQWVLSAESKGGSKTEIECEHVFLACGAVQTPLLLRKSGIKNNIGNSLQYHPTIKVVAQFADEINNGHRDLPVHQVTEFSPKMRFGGAVTTLPHLSVGLIDQAAMLPDLQNNWKKMAVYYATVSGGLGSVRPLPFLKDAFVQQKLGAQEMTLLQDALQKLCQCLLRAGAQSLYPSVVGSPTIRSESDIETLTVAADTANLMTVHLFSSCPMGEVKERCATDSFGKVLGQPNLYICDASVLCNAPGVNPQGTIMAVARRNVLNFLGRL
jgi:choline dehydrogenase-like flavoprotein